MKKILITTLFLLITIGSFGQNEWKYRIWAKGGLSVGNTADTAKIDSIILSGSLLKFYRGGQIVLIDGLSTTSLNNLSAVAINTHLLPAVDGAVNLGSVTKKFGDIHQDSAKGINWNNGDITLIGTANKLTMAGGTLDLPAGVHRMGSDTIASKADARAGGGGSTGMIYPSGSGIPLIVSGNSWGTTITNNSAEWNKAGVVGDGTAPPYFDGTSDGGQMLYFYGNNGFYTALQGGAPLANRSYRLPIAALPSAGTTSLMNIDENGNMGFVPSTTYAPLSHSQAQTTITGLPDSLLNRYTKAQVNSIISNIETGSFDTTYIYRIIDSLLTVLGDSVGIETLLQINLETDTVASLSDIRSLVGSAVIGVTLNGGTLTLTGDLATADDVTFYTNGDGQYDLPAGGGNLTIMSQVQGWINDSLDNAKVDIRKFDSDTIPLFVFGLGSGHSADTALFNNGRLAGAFYNSGSDTLYVTELRGVLVEGTGTETIDVQVSWHTNMKDVSAINLNTTALTISNMTTGTSDVSFNNNGIPPGRWVWCVLSGASSGNKPTALMLTMTGYRRNRSY